MKMYNVIASGSTGNCEIYGQSIMVDIGIPLSSILKYVYQIQIVLLSHEHTDHLNLATLTRLAHARPTLRIATGKHLVDKLQAFKNVDVCEIGTWYDYGKFKICQVRLYHDCPNVGWRIFIKQPDGEYYKIFRATDTATLQGIEAKNYSLYAIEHSYDEDVIGKIIAEKEAAGIFSYEKGAVNSHLSEQQARQFIFNNAGENYEVLRLHESKREYSKI